MAIISSNRILFFCCCVMRMMCVIAGTLPCKTIPESTDKKFMSYTLVDLYRDPKTYYASDLPQQCNMKYIDLITIVPADAKKETLWISYLGDSLARDLFHAAAQRFGGYHPFLKAEETTFDAVMANHLGPEGTSFTSSASLNFIIIVSILAYLDDMYL